MEREGSQATPRFNVGATARDWLHELRLMRSCLDAQMGRICRLERELVILIRASDTSENRVIAGEDPIACNLAIHWRSDGYAAISIDGGAKFLLPPQLAVVFALISADKTASRGRDPLVSWHSREEIAGHLSRHLHRPVAVSYVNNLVHRLRKALRQAGYDTKLIQTHRLKGVRFAYKWVAGGLIEFPEQREGFTGVGKEEKNPFASISR